MYFTNIYYFRIISKIGGIETFFYEMSKKYGVNGKDIDLAIVYSKADPLQLARLKKNIRCIQHKPGQKYECERAFFNFNTDIIDDVTAKEYFLVVHGDYKQLGARYTPRHPKINRYVGVSKIACDAFTEITGIPCEKCYNPLQIEPVKPVLHLVSACRLNDQVKGGQRTLAMIRALDKYCERSGRNYLWTVFSNQPTQKLDSPNVAVMQPRLDIRPYLADTDFVVSLSDDFEGYNYTNNEALSYGTPIVSTPCKVYKELGIDETMAIWVDFDLSNLEDVCDKMFSAIDNGWPKFQYKAPNDGWSKLLVKSKSNYMEELKDNVLVVVRDGFDDIEAGVYRKPGEVFEVAKDRYLKLSGDNSYKRVFVEKV